MAAIKEVIEKGGGTWINGDRWDERRLAYPIKKKKRGLYIISHFTAPTDAVARIDRNARLSDTVIRHMITVDEDGLTTVPPVRPAEEDELGGPGGGPGGERRFFGGGGGYRGDRDRDRGDRGDRGDRDRGDRGGRERPRDSAAPAAKA
jgi:small subunit ribosomal protein S6